MPYLLTKDDICITPECDNSLEGCSRKQKYCDVCKKIRMQEARVRYRERKADEIVENRKRWEIANPEKQAESKLKWRRNNPDKVKVYNKMHRGTGKAVNRKQLLKRDGPFCGLCRTMLHDAFDSLKVHVDHILPASLGGDGDIANLQLACAECNLSKGNNICGAY